MNENLAFERSIADVISTEGSSAAPSGAVEDILTLASQTRPLPRWLALIKESPMRVSSRVAVGSPTLRVAAIMVTTLLITLMVAGAGVAGSRLLAADGPIVVDQGGAGTVTTITEAVAMAEDGDTILVNPGTYDESVSVTKDITIRGDGDRAEIVIELSVEIPVGQSGSATDLPVAFLFDESDATLQNLTLRGESARIVISGGSPVLEELVLDGIGRVYTLDPGQPTPTGLDLNDGTTATIKDSALIDTDVDIETDSSPTLLNNEFSIGAIWMEGVGVDPVIRDNVIADSVKWGISVNAGARPTIEGNTISGAQRAIEISNGGFLVPSAPADAMVLRNTISGSRSAGISVGSGSSATIESNILTDNRTGISTSDGTLEGNTIQEGIIGIALAGGSPALQDNTVEGTSRGLVIGIGSTPTLVGNTICGNETNLVVNDPAEMPDTTDNEICEDAPVE